MLAVGRSAKSCLQLTAVLADNLTETSEETLSQNHMAKLLPDSWPSETEKINICCFKLSLGVICYTAIDN